MQAAINKFYKAALFPGIVDEKNHTIYHIQIGTGSFDTGVWRSSKYDNPLNWFYGGRLTVIVFIRCSKLLKGKTTKRLIFGSCHAFKTNVLKHRLIRFNYHGDRFSLHTYNKHLTAPEFKIKLKEYKKEKRNVVQNFLRTNNRKKVPKSRAPYVLK